MIFGRSKARSYDFEASGKMEHDTVKRWQSIAAQAFHNVTEYACDKEVAVWPSASKDNTVEHRTILLTDVAALDSVPGFDLDEDPIPPAAPALRPVEPPQPQPVPPCDLSVSIDEDLKRRFGANIHSALGPGTVIEGTFRFDAPVCIDGTLLGEVSSSSVLIVGEQAHVQARIRVGSLVVLGTVCGEVEANELVEIRASGRLEGDILTKRLSVEEGGWFTGGCNIVD